MRTPRRAAAALTALVLSAGLTACNGEANDDRSDTPGLDTGVDPAEREGTGGEVDPGTDIVDPTPSPS